MTLSSLYARIVKTNKNLRFRKKTPYMGLHGPLTLAGVYRRLDYMGFCLDGNDVWFRSRPVRYRKYTSLADGRELVEVAADRRRGRETFIHLLRSKRLIGRAGEQLLSL